MRNQKTKQKQKINEIFIVYKYILCVDLHIQDIYLGVMPHLLDYFYFVLNKFKLCHSLSSPFKLSLSFLQEMWVGMWNMYVNILNFSLIFRWTVSIWLNLCHLSSFIFRWTIPIWLWVTCHHFIFRWTISVWLCDTSGWIQESPEATRQTIPHTHSHSVPACVWRYGQGHSQRYKMKIHFIDKSYINWIHLLPFILAYYKVWSIDIVSRAVCYWILLRENSFAPNIFRKNLISCKNSCSNQLFRLYNKICLNHEMNFVIIQWHVS